MPKNPQPSTLNHQPSSYWANMLADKIIDARGKKIIVESGISPSGPYHIGHFREVLTADALKSALIKAGGKALHFHFVDDFDPLRKRYPYLPTKYERDVGKPLFLVPDPENCHESYSAHYFSKFEEEMAVLGVKTDRIFFSHLEYQKGRFAPYIELAILKHAEIVKILKEVSGRDLSDEGPLLQILCSECRKITGTQFTGWNKENKTISYRCKCGQVDQANYAEGEVKLTWRLDWPARWHSLGITAEPFGKEHATKGGSYDTGKAIIEKIFDGEPVYPVPYDTINRKGEQKKMSSSLGNVITASEAASVMPPEIMRYFVLRSRPEKQLDLDMGLGLFNLMEEFSKAEMASIAGQEHEFLDAYGYAKMSGERIISSVPFSHLVTAYQSAQKNHKTVFEILERTGYGKNVKEEKALLLKELMFIDNWLERYAPDDIKFEVLADSPKIKLTPNQKKFLSGLAGLFGKPQSADKIHDGIYGNAERSGITPKEAFSTLYQIFLGRDKGPRLGFFLASLDQQFVVKRLSNYS